MRPGLKTGVTLGIIGGGYAGRSLARKLRYDYDVTVISSSLYHLDNTSRLENALGYPIQEENSLLSLEDMCHVIKREVLNISKKADGTYDILDHTKREYNFEKIILSLGCDMTFQKAELFLEMNPHIFSTCTTMQSVRLRHVRSDICTGHLRIFTGGVYSNSHFNAISVGWCNSACLLLAGV